MNADWGVPGQGKAVAVLRGAVARGEVGHAWAFVGPRGVGQAAASRALAAAVNCPSTADGDPCGECDVCARCSRGAFPAYWEFAPVGAVHRVDDVREQWLHAAARTPAEGRWKVLHVLEADRMNESAANAFLKGLEEPPPATSWVLEVADPDELPDTILSRCRVVPFPSWGPGDLDEQARRLGIDDAVDRALAVRMAMGSSAVLERLTRPGALEDLRAHRQIPRRLREHGPGFALTAAKQLDEEVKSRTAALREEAKQQRAGLEEQYGTGTPRGVGKQLEERQARREREARAAVVTAALDDLSAWYRDCLLVAVGGDPSAALHADDAEGLGADAAALGPAALLRACDLVLTARERFESNLQQGLALEALFLELAALELAAVGARR